MIHPAAAAWQPARDCALCPRLKDFRTRNRGLFPAFHNAPVPAFGPLSARLLVVGLAPGLKGANRTGRPFTGDYAGDLLYATLLDQGFAQGRYGAAGDDGLSLSSCRITNAVRCVPPENKPTPAETTTCNRHLAAELAAMPDARAVLALGAIAHRAVLAALGLRQAAHPFTHGAIHGIGGALRLYDSYHCSRLNTNTGRLTAPMFQAVVARIARDLAANNPLPPAQP